MNPKINIQEIEEENLLNNPEQMRNDIFQLLLLKKRGEATEILVKALERKTKFFTTQFDDASEVYYYEEGIYRPEGRSYIKQYCREILNDVYTEPLANAVVSKIEADSFIPQEKFLKRHYSNKIACLNGIINLTTGELEPFNQEMIFFTKVNAKFNPEAKGEKIDAFLKSILPGEDDVKTIYEMFGYCLDGGYYIQKIVLLIGAGENGKGQLLELLRQFLGEGNFAGIPLQKLEDGDFKEFELFRKLANIGADISDSPLKTTAKIKGLSGGDSINASRKFKNDLTFINEAKLIFSANKLPKTYDLTHAFFRRWVYLQFPFKFVTEKEYELNSKKEFLKIKVPDIVKGILCEEELSGLLNKSLEGLTRLKANKDFTASKSNQETRNWWIRNSDSFLAFCGESLEQADTDLEMVSKDNLRKKYQTYCREHRLLPEGDKHIHEIMVREMGAWESQLSDEQRERVWKGVKFKDFKEGVLNV